MDSGPFSLKDLIWGTSEECRQAYEKGVQIMTEGGFLAMDGRRGSGVAGRTPVVPPGDCGQAHGIFWG